MAENLGKLLPDIGSMDELITIRQRSLTTDSTGGVTESWSNLAADVWARVESSSQSDEGTRGEPQQIVAWDRLRFTVRAVFTLDKTMRILYNSKEYDILNIATLGRSRFNIIEAENRDNAT